MAMVCIGVQFSSGRYHATPWGRHVNEGAIEWPPSPWRIMRALVATGFSKLGWPAIPHRAAETLAVLAGHLPVFHLPVASEAHTRHYMPVYKGSPDKVIDTFAYPGRASPGRTPLLVIEWRVAIDGEQVELVETLFGKMSYLGRAESWIEARRIDSVPDGLIRCAPIEPGDDGEDRIDLLAPVVPGDFPHWRQSMLAREQERRLESKREVARQKGNRPPGKLSKKDREDLERELPESWLDALCVDTADLQKGGWNQPPGSRWVTYLRPQGALDNTPMKKSLSTGKNHDTALLALVPDTRRAPHLPRLEDALARCEMLHQTLVKKATTRAGEPGNTSQKSALSLSPCFTGMDESGQALLGHQHATLIPLELEQRPGTGKQRRSIDHIAVHTPMGFDEPALVALRATRKTYAKNHPGLFVTVVNIGRRADFENDIPQFNRSRVWVSETPFVPPRFLKPRGRNSLVGQVCAELASRGIAVPVESVESIEVEIRTASGITYRDAADFWALWRPRYLPTVALRGGEGGDAAAQDDLVSDEGRARAEPTAVLSHRWRRFRRRRHKDKPQPPMPVALGLRLRFARPIRGPLSLGYASHFGLGSFVPESP